MLMSLMRTCPTGMFPSLTIWEAVSCRSLNSPLTPRLTPSFYFIILVFNYAQQFNADVSKWDVAKVTKMSYSKLPLAEFASDA